jgi:hypothetical protein
MRPDHFFRMVEAYHYNEEKSWMQTRRLGAIILNMMRGESDKVIKDSDVQWLPMIDKPFKKITSPKIIMTPEEMRERAIKAGIIKE